MVNKEFLLQRICVYAGREIDPCADKDVEKMLLTKFNIRLPQRSSMNDALASTISDHEILSLLIEYRTMAK
jgi:DNA polymerase I-like protein with 3'-5' exonuclease and polymerase domains